MDSSGDLFGTTYGGGTQQTAPFSRSPRYELHSHARQFQWLQRRESLARVTLDSSGDLFGTAYRNGGHQRRHGFRDRPLARAPSPSSPASMAPTANSRRRRDVRFQRRPLWHDLRRRGQQRRHGLRDRPRHIDDYHHRQLQWRQRVGPAASRLTLDSSGDLFGTTCEGGTSSDGTVFEIAHGTTAIITVAVSTESNGGLPSWRDARLQRRPVRHDR